MQPANLSLNPHSFLLNDFSPSVSCNEELRRQCIRRQTVLTENALPSHTETCLPRLLGRHKKSMESNFSITL